MSSISLMSLQAALLELLGLKEATPPQLRFCIAKSESERGQTAAISTPAPIRHQDWAHI